MLRMLNKLFNYKSERERKLEDFYFNIHTNNSYLRDHLLHSCNSDSKTYVAIEECFDVLDCYINNKSNSEVVVHVISEGFKHRPDLISKLVLPRLLAVNTKITPEQIRSID